MRERKNERETKRESVCYVKQLEKQERYIPRKRAKGGGGRFERRG